VAWGGGDAAGTPIEALVGGWWKAADPLTLRLGVGRGLTSGIGASGGRALLAAEWRPVPSKRPAANPPAANPPAANPSGSSRGSPPTGGAAASTATAPARTDARVIPGPTSPGDGPKVLPPTATVAVAPPATVAVAPPDARPAHVTITREKLLLPANVEFDGARIEPASYPVLDEVVAVLRAHPEITGVRIEGHTDDAGSPDDDLTLSGARAAAVQDYFVQRGLDPGRFLVAGYGSSRPLDRSGTDAARARNRRIELVITDWREGTAPP
jgi:outer membrane protein OmpA-like peptidoglycan-associated protein